ncbi:malic enzyme [Arthrobacter sp. V4I6]|nr:malic enzyme [Arthrobacter sp. V1I7]MDQ0855558.1 malic enzyme [Arthrobacter sp. V4I6]
MAAGEGTTFLMHLGGKLEIVPKVALRNRDDLSRAYTPGVARVCQAIAENPDAARNLTVKRNTIAVVTDGSAVLGLGNIGAAAALPVMEGKAALFKQFANVDAWPVCLDTQDTEENIKIVKAIAPVYGGVNLEDIAAPRCFEIENRLRASMAQDAIAKQVADDELNASYIIPSLFDPHVAADVAAAAAKCSRSSTHCSPRPRLIIRLGRTTQWLSQSQIPALSSVRRRSSTPRPWRSWKLSTPASQGRAPNFSQPVASSASVLPRRASWTSCLKPRTCATETGRLRRHRLLCRTAGWK